MTGWLLTEVTANSGMTVFAFICKNVYSQDLLINLLIEDWYSLWQLSMKKFKPCKNQKRKVLMSSYHLK